MKFKIERIKKLIKNEIMKIVSEGSLKDPRIPTFFTITKIKLSKDLHFSHIYFSLFGDDTKKKLAIIGFNNASGFIQKILSERLKLKYTPKIEFRYDEDDDKANKVDQILSDLSNERNKLDS